MLCFKLLCINPFKVSKHLVFKYNYAIQLERNSTYITSKSMEDFIKWARRAVPGTFLLGISIHKLCKMLLVSVLVTEASNQLCRYIVTVGDYSSAAEPVPHIAYSQSTMTCAWGPSLPSIQCSTQRLITELQQAGCHALLLRAKAVPTDLAHFSRGMVPPSHHWPWMIGHMTKDDNISCS